VEPSSEKKSCFKDRSRFCNTAGTFVSSFLAFSKKKIEQLQVILWFYFVLHNETEGGKTLHVIISFSLSWFTFVAPYKPVDLMLIDRV